MERYLRQATAGADSHCPELGARGIPLFRRFTPPPPLRRFTSSRRNLGGTLPRKGENWRALTKIFLNRAWRYGSRQASCGNSTRLFAMISSRDRRTDGREGGGVSPLRCGAGDHDGSRLALSLRRRGGRFLPRHRLVAAGGGGRPGTFSCRGEGTAGYILLAGGTPSPRGCGHPAAGRPPQARLIRLSMRERGKGGGSTDVGAVWQDGTTLTAGWEDMAFRVLGRSV